LIFIVKKFGVPGVPSVLRVYSFLSGCKGIN